MDIDNIFSKLSSHMVEGMMVHEQLMNAYLFLGLPGYAACHEYHYLEETKEYISLQKFKMKHFGTLIDISFVSKDVPKIIPQSWYQYIRDDANTSTRKESMMAAFDEWVKWEEKTKDLYTACYEDLMTLHEIPSAEYVKELILSVEEEIAYAKDERLAKSSMDFDIVSILEEQKQYENSFKKKIRKG